MFLDPGSRSFQVHIEEGPHVWRIHVLPFSQSLFLLYVGLPKLVLGSLGLVEEGHSLVEKFVEVEVVGGEKPH